MASAPWLGRAGSLDPCRRIAAASGPTIAGVRDNCVTGSAEVDARTVTQGRGLAAGIPRDQLGALTRMVAAGPVSTDVRATTWTR